MPIVKLARRTWWYLADSRSPSVTGGVGVIVTDEGSVVVDAGNSPRHARRVQSSMAEAGLPPATHVVYTHHHWDHTWGACAWPDVEIIGHETGRDLLRAEAEIPWSNEYLTQRMAEDSSLRPGYRARARVMENDWDEFTVVPPQRVFTDRLTLPGGVEVRHVGGQHAPDSTIVVASRSKVVFLGDCFYPPPHHLRTPDDAPDMGMVGDLLEEGYKWYVDSHSPPHRRWRAKRMVARAAK